MLKKLFGYDVFIAHDHADAHEFARRLKQALSEQSNPIHCFLDCDEYHIGEELNAATQRNLRKSTYLLVIASPGILRPNSWVSEEIAVFCRLLPENTDRILLVNVDGTIEKMTASHKASRYVPFSRTPGQGPSRLFFELGKTQLDIDPSQNLLHSIGSAIGSQRVQKRRNQYFKIAGAAFAALMMAIGFIGYLWVAENNRLHLSTSSALINDAERLLSDQDRPSAALAMAHLAVSNHGALFPQEPNPVALRIAKQAMYHDRSEKIVRLDSDDLDVLDLGDLDVFWISADEKTAFVGSYYSRIQQVDLEQGAVVHTYRNEDVENALNSRIGPLQVLPDPLSPSHFYASYKDNTIYRYHKRTGSYETFRDFSSRSDRLTSFNFSPDKNFLFAEFLQDDRTYVAIAWDESNAGRHIDLGPSNRWRKRGFDQPDFKIYDETNERILNIVNGKVTILDLKTGVSLDFPNMPKNVAEATFNHEHTAIAVRFNSSRVVEIWDATPGTRQQVPILSEEVGPKSGISGRDNEVKQILFYDHDNSLAVVTRGNELISLDIKNSNKRGKTVKDIRHIFAIASDAQHALVERSYLGGFSLLNLASGTEVNRFWSHNEDTLLATFANDDQEILSYDEAGEFRVWSAKNNFVKTLSGHSDAIRSIDVTTNGEKILASSDDGTATIWDVRKQELLEVINLDGKPILKAIWSPDETAIALLQSGLVTIRTKRGLIKLPIRRAGHKLDILGFSFSPGSEKLASFDASGTIAIWNAESGELIHSYSLHRAKVTAMEFSSNGKYLLSSSEDGTVRVNGVDVEPVNYLLNLPRYENEKGEAHFITGLDINKNGTVLLLTYSNGFVHTWDLNHGKIVDKIDTGNVEVRASYSGNGQLGIIATDQNAFLYDVSPAQAFKKKPVVARVGDDEINFQEYLIDQNQRFMIFEHYYDSSVYLVDIMQQAVTASFAGYSSDPTSMAFGNNSAIAVTGHKDGGIKLWPIWDTVNDLEQIQNVIADEATKTKALTQEECRALKVDLKVSCP